MRNIRKKRDAAKWKGRFKWPYHLLRMLLSSCLIFLNPYSLPAQSGYQLDWGPAQDKSIWRDLPLTINDTSSLFDTLQQSLEQLHGYGYLEAAIDDWSVQDSTILLHWHLGQHYSWLELRIPDDLQELAPDRRWKQVEQIPFEQWPGRRQRLLQRLSENGYPFARVRLDSLVMGTDRKVWATLAWEPGGFVRWDSLKVQGDVRLAPAFLQGVLEMQAGDPFEYRDFLEIPRRLQDIPYLELNGNPSLVFRGEKAEVTLPLRKRRSSRFDFLIGVLPNSAQVDRLLITGSFEAELYNQLARGERIYARFEQLRPQTQLLDLALNYPYLFNLPFGVEGSFHLYRRDTTFLNLDLDIGVQYLISSRAFLKGFIESSSSRLLSIDEAVLEATGQLPNDLDTRSTSYGLQYNWSNVDYRFNPRRGWELSLRASAGTRRILINNRIEELGFGYLYDSLQTRSNQYRTYLRLERYFPLWRRSTLQLALTGFSLFSDAPVYRNEQHRLGGNRLLRGFDEEFFFATRYGVGTLEYRLLLDRNSYLYVFGDYGLIGDYTEAGRNDLQAYGFGAGLTFETRAGLFGISLAIGGQNGTPPDFRAPKVHFGYLSLF